MKKLLAMVLALVMTLSLAVSANAAFKDADKVSADYSEAVAVLSGMGVFQGYPDGSFQPQGDITRAEVAAIVYRVYTKDVKDAKASLYATYNKFSDMAGAGWAQGYIGYCANAEIVKGYPNGTFQPSGKVTGYEVLAMILRAIGYDKNGEFSGADWALHVAQTAQQAHVLDNVKGVDLNAAATRELVAELLFRAIAKAPMVTYTAAFGYQTVSFNGKADGKTFKENETLGHQNFDLKGTPTNGDYGRPATKWEYNVGDKSTTIYDKPVATYTEAFAPCDLCKDLSQKKEAKVTVAYVDGENDVKVATDLVATYKASNTDKDLGDQGQLVEVYENESGKDYTVVVINTYLAQVTKVIDEVKDKNDHVKVDASVNVNVFGWSKDKASFETEGFKKDDLVLVTVDDGEIASMEAAKGETAKLTGAKGVQTVGRSINGIKNVLAVGYEKATVACKATGNPYTSDLLLGSTYTFYYDTYGNIIGVDFYAPNSDYVIVDRIWADHDNGKGSVHADLIKVENGEKLSNVIIDSIDTLPALNQVLANVETIETKAANKAFYADLMTYTVNKDGEYELNNKEDSSHEIGVKVKFQDNWVRCYYDSTRDNDLIYTQGTGNGNVYLDKDTVILAQYDKSPEGTYKSYTMDNLPTKFTGYVEYVVGSNGKADVAYIQMADVTTGYVFVPEASNATIDTEMLDKDTVKLTLNDVYIVSNDGKVSEKTTLSVTGNPNNIVIENYDALDGGKFVDIDDMKAGLYQLTTLGENDSFLSYVKPVQISDLHDWNNNKVSFVANDTKIDLDKVSDYTAWTGTFAGTDESVPYAKVLKNVTDTDEGLANGDWVYVQYDEKFENVVAVYKADFEASVKVGDAKATYGHHEFIGKDFADVKVSLKEYEQIASVKMGGTTMDAADYTVTYYKADGTKIGTELDAKGTQVGYAVISSNEKVSGDVEITVSKQERANWDEFVTGTYHYDALVQSITIAGDASSEASARKITVTKAGGDVTAQNLKDKLAEAKYCTFETIEVYNTDQTTIATGELASGMFVKVTSWDGSNSLLWQIEIQA